MEKRKKEADAKPGIGAWFKSLEAEFKKIIWPDRTSLIRQSVAVIASAVSLGFLIALLDAIIKFGFGFIIK
ncbi:MAG: preprotein translocase subunit SecE [Lachnospiraceae bacterium]|nr:preprotein translocase subunit SecE [Lachnospiraceae bacterium]